MIVGKLKDLGRYKGIAKNIDTAIDYLANNDVLALAPGKYKIDGDNVILNRDSYVARPLEECFFENHDVYMDIQIVLKGQEVIGYTDISNPTLTVTTPYDNVKDVTKYACEGAVFFTLEEGYALVYPEDIHLAKCKANDDIVEKVVMKIKIENK